MKKTNVFIEKEWKNDVVDEIEYIIYQYQSS